MLADGELGPEAEAAVMAFVEEHEEYRALLDLYLSLKLEPEQETVFPGRESLLHEEPLVKPLQRKRTFMLLPVAAAAACLICVLVFWGQKEPEPKRPAVAMHQEKAMPAPAVPSQDTGALLAAVPQDKRRPHKNRPEPAPVRSAVAQARAAGNPDPLLPARPQQEIARLYMVREPLIVAAEPVPVQAGVPVELLLPAVDKVIDAQEWTPFKEETVEGVEELVAQVKAIRENVQEKTRMLKKATIVFRLGDKEFALNK